ncbi:MAG: hypothetical protein HZA89_09800 [Verrucomicrobia bacterium]|nr:hypothetical protein [Verrucomicrobiota bacterium]
MKNLSKEKQQQIIATAIGAVVVCGLIWYFVIMGQQKTLADTRKKIQETESQIAAADGLIKKKQAVADELGVAQKKIDELEEGMASGDMYSWVIQTVNKFKLGHKVDIRSYSRDEPVKVGVLPGFPYQGAKYILMGSGYYHDLGKFIADFENKFSYFRVQNLELAQGGGEVGSGDTEKLAFKLEIVVLVKPAAAAAKP